jgi:hypothetical protein
MITRFRLTGAACPRPRRLHLQSGNGEMKKGMLRKCVRKNACENAFETARARGVQPMIRFPRLT